MARLSFRDCPLAEGGEAGSNGDAAAWALFYKVHRLLAIAYLVLAFHGAVLMEVGYWASPLGMTTTVLLAYGTAAAIVVLFRRVGAHRRVDGTIISLQYHQSLRVLEGKVDVLQGAVLHGPVQ